MFLQNGSRPPTAMVTPKGPQLFFIIFTHIPLVIFVAVAISNIVKRRDPTLLAFLTGGSLAIVMEPVVDVLGFCYFPSEGQLVGLRVFERDIPMFMWAVYSWFVGGQGYLFYEKFRMRRCTKSELWRLYAVLTVVNALLELPGLLLGVYTYYGNQPFQILGFPLWWPALNPVMPIAAGFAASILVPHAGKFGSLAMVLLPVMADGAVNGAIGWPVWTALGRDSSYTVTHTAALMSLCLALFFIWGMTTQLPDEKDTSISNAKHD